MSAVTPAMRRALQYAAENGGSFKFWKSGTFSHRTVARCRNAGLLKEIRPQGVGALKWELTDLGAAVLHP